MSEEIILLTHEFPPFRGGAGVYCEEMAVAASKVGIKVRILAPRGSYSSAQLPIFELPWKGSQSWTSSFRLIRKLKGKFLKNNPEQILHFAEPGTLRALLRFGWMLPQASNIMLTIHGSELLRFIASPLEKYLFKRTLARCFRIHVLSNYNFNQLYKFYPKAKPKTVIAAGAPSSMVAGVKEKKDERDNKEIRLLCVGRVHPRKGQLLLLETCKSLPHSVQKRLNVTFAGPIVDKRYDFELKNSAKSFGGMVDCTGEVTDQKLSALYQSSDIFALTSVKRKRSIEGFGFVYLEASSHGLPILATRVGGVEDAVIHEKTGLIAEPGCVDDIRSKLIQLIQDQNLRKTLGNNGLKWSQSHSWEKVARKLYLEN